MFDIFFDAAGWVLAGSYSIIQSYAFAIFGLTVVIMVISTPLTLKSTRSMMAMQRLQPEIKRLQKKHAGDRQELNQEMMKLYQERGVNPLGGCLPILVQMPIFLLLFRIIRNLTNTDEGKEGFQPRNLDEGTQLAKDLTGSETMSSFGIDLARSAREVLGDSVVDGIPYLLLIAVYAAISWFTQRQMMARRSQSGVDALPANQQILMRILPYIGVVFGFFFEAALIIYWITQSLWRAGQQAFINRTMPFEPPPVVDVDDDEDEAPKKSGSKKSAQNGGSKASSASSAKNRTNTRSQKARSAADRRDSGRGGRLDRSGASQRARSNGGGGGGKPAPTSRTAGAAARRRKKRR